MVQLLEHSEIDFKKYDDCIRNGLFSVLYAESWYLNIAAGNDWKIFVVNDYQAVMPIAFGRLKRSFWKSSVMPPPFTQQLGVFSKSPLTQEEFDLFWNELIALNPAAYYFNHLNSLYLTEKSLGRFRTNFILNLNRPFEEIFKGYSSTKKQSVRKAEKSDLNIIQSDDIELFTNFFNQHSKAKEADRILNRRKQLIQELLDREVGRIYLVYLGDELLAAAFLAFYKDRIYYLNSVSSDAGRKYFAMDFLLNTVIRENSEKPLIFDFEGSELPGVSDFMRRFGAENQPFYVI